MLVIITMLLKSVISLTLSIPSPTAKNGARNSIYPNLVYDRGKPLNVKPSPR